MPGIKINVILLFINVLCLCQPDAYQAVDAVDSKVLKPCLKLCTIGYQCKNGECVPKDKCARVRCRKGYKCMDGKCYKIKTTQPNVCPVNSAKPKKCTTRPTQKQCPTIFYIREPDPVACGVKADGTRVSFSEECSACKDKSIVSYFNTPCHKAPFTCSKAGQCLGYYCGNERCSQNGDCPYDWQVCDNGKCADSCILKDCLGSCKYGQCSYQQPYGECLLNDDSKCKNGWKCIVSQCGDKCWNKRCPANQNCNKDNGACQPQIIIY